LGLGLGLGLGVGLWPSRSITSPAASSVPANMPPAMTKSVPPPKAYGYAYAYAFVSMCGACMCMTKPLPLPPNALATTHAGIL